MTNVDVKDLMQNFSTYLCDNYGEKLAEDSGKFISDFVADMNTDKLPEIRAGISGGMYHFDIIDCLFFIKYYFNYLGQKFDFYDFNFIPTITVQLNLHISKYHIENYNESFDRIIFDKLDLSRDELRLPCLKILKVKNDAAIASSDPDDMITLRADYALTYYYAQKGDLNKFADCYEVKLDEKTKKGFDDLRECLTQNKIKVLAQDVNWIQLKGKRSSLIKFIEFAIDNEWIFDFEPFCTFEDDYYASIQGYEYYSGDEFWYWNVTI